MGETHIVEQGEYLASIAKDYGFSDWHIIYDQPENADLRTRRPNPNVLLPGDQIFIPDKEQKQEACPTEQKTRFQVKVPKATLLLILKDSEGKALASQAYTLNVAWLTFQGTTDGNGKLQQKIPLGIETGKLELAKLGLTWNLKIGHLDPLQDGAPDAAVISGMQERLNNLGFHCGAVDGILGPKTERALQLFQQTVMGRRDADGTADAQTCVALMSQHGS
jgi:N-acetylmuramoyl-L-alanine amidase